MNKKTKFILLEFAVYTILFGLSLTLFPICTYYFLGENDQRMITEPQYFLDFPFAYLFPIFFGMVLIGFLTMKRIPIITINVLVMVAALLLFGLINISFAWWGVSPFLPDLASGYWLSQVILFVLIIRTFTLLGSLSQFSWNKKVKIGAFIFASSLPLTCIIYLLGLYLHAQREPVSISASSKVVRGRSVYAESWNYMVAHNAKVVIYNSSDTLDMEDERLDSVRFTFYDENQNIRKRFTRKAKNGKLDIDKILEAND